MKFWAHSLKNQFIVVFGCIALLIGAVVAVGHLGVSSTIGEFQRLTEQEISHERRISAMVSGFKKQVQEWKNVLLRGADDEQRAKYWGKFEKQEAALQQEGQALVDGMPETEARRLLGEFLAAHTEMGTAYRKGLQAFIEAGYVASAGDAAVKGIDRAPTRLLEDAAGLIAEDARSVTASTLARATNSARLALAGVIVVLLASVSAAVVFIRSRVLRPLCGIESALNQMAGGDFRVEIDARGQDELGRVGASAQRLRDDLGDLLGNVVQMAQELDQAGRHLADLGMQNRNQLDLQQQGTSQVATASEELAATAREVAGSAAGAADAAHRAERSTAAGRAVVTDAIAAINRLETDVGQVNEVLADLDLQVDAIGNVLGVIRGIAEQTNLLALNAAIEAARAGDQGRGFAVVADEVRSLAQRTQESTQEIQLTIEQLQQGSKAAVHAMEQGKGRVDEGVARTREVGEALEQIAAAVASIVDMSTQIATAAEEQGVVAGDVSRNVSEIDGSSAQLVGSAETLAQTSSQIAGLSASLVQAAGRFHF